MELPIAFSPLRRWKIWALCSFGLSSSRVRSVTVWVSYHLKVLWGDWLAFWTCIPFGNTEISVLPYVSWQQRSNLTAIQGFLSVPGLDGFYDGITLFFCFPLLWHFVSYLYSLSLREPLLTCSVVFCLFSLCWDRMHTWTRGLLLSHAISALLSCTSPFCARVSISCAFLCCMENILSFINSNLVGWSASNPATSAQWGWGVSSVSWAETCYSSSET